MNALTNEDVWSDWESVMQLTTNESDSDLATVN